MKIMHDQTIEKSHNNSPLAKILFNMLTNISHGSLKVITPDGKHHYFSGTKTGEDVCVSINDWRFCDELLLKGDVGLGESYVLGYWDCDNINMLVKWGIENKEPLERAIKGSITKILFYRFKHFLKRNSKKGSIKNIHAHYDIGNKFYQLWLDSTMTYSSAIFKSSNEKLSEAQENKYQNILNKLKPKDGDHILDVGCGWGGFAEYLGKNYNVKLDCITISKKQYQFAKERIYKIGLNEKINIEIKDYRDLKGKYDSIASIEMIEAVGQNYLQSYFNTIKNNLSKNGNAAIQSITIDDNLFDRYKTKEDFIQKYIFPGGFLPSKKSLYNYAESNGLILDECNSYAKHYSDTLIIWRKEFNNKWSLIKNQGFDLTFKKMWEFYLSYCEAGFKSKNIDLIQFSLCNK